MKIFFIGEIKITSFLFLFLKKILQLFKIIGLLTFLYK